MMKITQLNKNTALVFVLMWCVLIFSTAIAQSQSSEGEVANLQQTQERLFVKGRVSHVSSEINTIVVKPNKGKRIEFLFNDQTIFKGFVFLNEIEDKHRIKVWYFTDGEKNRAVKVEKIPKLGC